MSQEQIDRFRNDDTTWHRPTWKLNPNNGTWWQDQRFGGDWFDLDDRPSPDNPGTQAGRTTGNNDPALDAFAILELDFDMTWGEVKARYKELVKRHHPDTNGGCKKAENRLKEVNRAYGVLKKWYEQ
jgi:DnaJ-domain-containing protein 1